MNRTPIVLAALLLATVGARGGVGDLSHVACDVKDALKPQPLDYGSSKTTEAPKGSGVVNPKASVFLLMSPGPPQKLVVSVAIDSVGAAATAPEVVRLDFTGAGKFAKAPSLPLDKTATTGGFFNAVFGPAAIKVQRGGETIPVTVSGRYYKSGTYRSVVLYLGTAVAGKCAFGETVLPVRVIDGNSDLSCGERPSMVLSARRVQQGDTLEIDFGDGKAPLKFFYGQPVLVKGSWYDVAISSDASKVTAKPLSLDAGKLKVAHEHWTCSLVKDKQVHHISGGSVPVALPAGEYKVIEYAEYTGDETKASRGKLEWSSFIPSVGSVTVRAGATAELAIGTPLRASTNVGRSGDAVVLNLMLTDAAGAAVRDLYLPRGSRPAPPKVSILDSSGKRVYQATMEYG